MLRKRSRKVEKDQDRMILDSQSLPDCFCSPSSNGTVAPKSKTSSFFSVPRLFVGFSSKCLSDCDAVRSPTSPLDYRLYSFLASPRSPRSPGPDAKHKRWDGPRVGLGLVDTLIDDHKPSASVVSDSRKCILFAPRMRANISGAPRSLPKDYGILSRKMQQSKVFNLDHREPRIPRSSSADISRSSMAASRFVYSCPKPGPEALRSKSENSVKDNEDFDKFGRSVPVPVPVNSPHELTSILSRKTLLSKVFDFDHREPGIPQSSSADIGRSSLPTSRFLYSCPKPDPKALQSKSENSDIGRSPLLASVYSCPKPGPKALLSNSENSVKDSESFDRFGESVLVPVPVGSSQELASIMSVTDIEQSEDYTCITSHGPNPRTTRIFGDFVLESSGIGSPSSKCDGTRGERPFWLLRPAGPSPCSSSNGFLSFCFSCNAKLDEGRDVYMYRGERAFCSCDCRDRGISMEEETEKAASSSSGSLESSYHEEMFLEDLV